ncbi:MAG: plastocyanin/azurin family copper-binding protein [Acidimicrobiales bacterium]
MPNFSSILRAVAVGCCAVALTSCGDDAGDDTAVDDTAVDDTADTAEQTDAAGTAEVVIDDFAFVSADLTVDVGTEVTWRNDQGVPHTVTGDNDEFDSAELAEGASFTQVFDEVGTFAYHCDIHPDMTGVVNVQG